MLSSILMMNATIYLFFDWGNRPRDLFFPHPYGVQNRPNTAHIRPTLRHFFWAGAYVREIPNEYFFLVLRHRGGEINNTKKFILFFFVFFSSSSSNVFGESSTRINNKFIKKTLTVALNFCFYFKTTNCRNKM